MTTEKSINEEKGNAVLPLVSNYFLLDIYSTISDMQQEMWNTKNHFKDETYKKIQKVKEELRAILNGC